MSFNLWVPQGIVVPAVGSDAPEQPTVFYETSAHILSPNADGKIFKMWFTTGAASSPVGVNYAESNDGLTWTRYSSNPVVATQWGARVFKNGSTYYMYSTDALLDVGGIKVRTSSDGLTWSAPTATGINHSGVGGTWNNLSVGQLNPVDVVGGIWYGYYWGMNSATAAIQRFDTGLATSTDGIHWTPDSGNPIAAFHGGTFLGGQLYNVDASLGFTKQNGVYYGWAQMTAFTGLGTAPLQMPSDIMRWSATNPAGPWTAENVISYSRASASEGFTSTNGQAADPCVIEVAGNSYIYYTASSNGSLGNSYTVNCAKATGSTLAQVVQTYEGTQNFPLNGDPSLNLNILASDTFHRANGAIGANWVAESGGAGFAAAEILSNSATSSVIGDNCDSTYNQAWANDQWAQVTVTACANSSAVGLTLRETSSTNQLTGYRLVWSGTLGTSGTLLIQRVIANAFSTLTSTAWTLNANDVLLGCAIGTNIFFFVNGVAILVFQDSPGVSAGNAGFLTVPATALADTALTNWSGGNFQNAPAFSFTISGNVGIANATVSYSGPTSGSVTSDSSGNYTIGNAQPGAYTITPSLSGHVFTPTSQVVTVTSSSISGVNFTTMGNHYSVPDCRNFGGFPNNAVNVNGTLTYTVQKSESRTAGALVDSRANVPVASGTYPQNSRTPGTFGPGE